MKECLIPISKQKKEYIKAKKSVSTDILSKYKHEKDFSSNHPDTRNLACEQALLFGRVKRVSRERASERRSLLAGYPELNQDFLEIVRRNNAELNWLSSPQDHNI